MKSPISIALLGLLAHSAFVLAAQTTPATPTNSNGSQGNSNQANSLHATVTKGQPGEVKVPVGVISAGRKNRLEFRSQEEMTDADRTLLLNAEGTIEERARFNDFAWNEGPWSLQQAVCPALPKHIIVQFTRTGGKGDVSVFTAVIPRDPEGRIRLIPVERRGYSLWSPAPVNAVTMNIFNRIRAEEKATTPPDWLTLGLCYASMAGSRSRADLIAEKPRNEQFPEGQPATLVIEPKGTAKIEFVDMDALPRPMHWVMSFDKKGRLLKATHHPADLVKVSKRTQQIVDVTPAVPQQAPTQKIN
jgi:hypothetical protein